MKKITIIAVAFIVSMGAAAQSESDLLLTSRIAPTGTARSLSLSNAMGAVGGDMTAITFNPAGIGVYRSSDFSFTTGLQFDQTKAEYLGNILNDDNTNFALSQLGFVSTFKNNSGDEKGIVSSHFGFSYSRLNNFNQNIWLSGINKTSSMLDMWALQANGSTQEDLNNEYNNSNSALAYKAYLINEHPEGSMQYDHVLGVTDESGQFQFQALSGMDQMQIIERSGNGGEYSLTGGINVGNILLIGGSLNFQNISNEQVSLYEETVVNGLTPAYADDLESFKFYETWNRYGTSTNVKLGIILKPINAIRFGFAFHSPNWYHMREEYYSQVSAKFLDNRIPYEASTGMANDFSYRLNTPMKFIGSFALVSGMGFISVDYEFQDYSTAEFKNYDSDYEYMDYFMGINNDIKTYFTQTHALRIGAELRIKSVLFRGGAGIYGSPYKEEYLSEPMHQRTYSAGIGYRQQNFYIDAGYMMITKNEDYYPYNYNAGDANNAYLVAGRVPEMAKLSSITHNAMLTVGFKF